MFKTSTRPRIRQPVPLKIEVDGDLQDHSFIATFKILDTSRTSEDVLQDEARQDAFLAAAIADLSDLDVPYTPDLLPELLQRVEVKTALIRAYFEAAKKAALGN